MRWPEDGRSRASRSGRRGKAREGEGESTKSAFEELAQGTRPDAPGGARTPREREREHGARKEEGAPRRRSRWLERSLKPAEEGGGRAPRQRKARAASRAGSARPLAPTFPSPEAALDAFRAWLRGRGMEPFAYQEECWSAFLGGESGLVTVPTGAGKTYAAYGGPLAALAAEPGAGLRLLYVSPLRAVTRDVEAALRAPLEELGMGGLRVESRTGDTSASVRARQRAALPHVLLTTPESLTLLLTREDAALRFAGLLGVIVDEWHELLGNKRGTQVELALARLRRFAPGLRTWGLSATLAKPGLARDALLGPDSAGRVVRAELRRPVELASILPEEVDAFPWAGHMGLAMLPRVLAWLDPERPTLVFTNTRSQAERWYEAIRDARPGWRSRLALHHGSIARAERERVERGVKAGAIAIVVCTSSLDLGVDFTPVERVLQIGSPRGVARLVQRAGRARHRPGAASTIACVPTHALELVEIVALREALARGELEARRPLEAPLDVLAQHLVTCALGGGFAPDEMLAELRTSWAYRALTRRELEVALSLVREGGGTLAAYDEHQRVTLREGRYLVDKARIARLHRLGVGTIDADATVEVRYASGRRLGAIDESFIARMRPGERFLFAGRKLELVGLRDMRAIVRAARSRGRKDTPRWPGTKLPISENLGRAMRRVLARVRSEGEAARPTSSELDVAWPVLEAQARLSRVPGETGVLVETTRTREGHHLFVYPFEGRLVHGGLAALVALRLARRRPATFALSANDYGFELLSPEPFPFAKELDHRLFTREGLVEDVLDSMNAGELARRQFREIARVAMLVFPKHPGAQRTSRSLQASAGLLYDVFAQHAPDHPLLAQARREVFARHFEEKRLARALERLEREGVELVEVPRPTPLAFPLVVERIGARLSTEELARRVERLARQWSRKTR